MLIHSTYHYDMLKIFDYFNILELYVESVNISVWANRRLIFEKVSFVG